VLSIVIIMLLAQTPPLAAQISAGLPRALELVAIEIPKGAPADARVQWQSPPRAGHARLALRSGAWRGWARIELRARPPVAPAQVASLGPPLPRGTAVVALSRAGAVTISTPARLERSAPIGGRAEARVTATGRLVRGTLLDGPALSIEEVSP